MHIDINGRYKQQNTFEKTERQFYYNKISTQCMSSTFTKNSAVISLKFSLGILERYK